MIFGVYGNSNSGKTTLVVRLIEELKGRGYKVGSLKHIHEPDFTIDTEGKDTWKHTSAGSEVVVAHSKDEAAFLVNRVLEPKDLTTVLNGLLDLDIVIVEGYWNEDIPKAALGDVEEKGNTVLRYNDNFDELVGLMVEGIEVERIERKLPGLDCGKCGKDKCADFARAVNLKENTNEECYYFSNLKASLEVNGRKIPLGKFAKDMMVGTISGMISSLKGVEEGKDIRIKIKK